MKPKLFIGSSSEFLYVAQTLESTLSAHFDVKVWDKAFLANEFFLERLQKELFLTDYALFIVAPDDEVNKRGKKTHASRDNVLFELGLFMGALGLKKAYFVIVELLEGSKLLHLEIPSDLDGIARLGITLNGDGNGRVAVQEKNSEEITAAASRITSALLRHSGDLHLNLLPSTSLAIGYYRNFILQACKELAEQPALKVNDIFYDLTKDNYDFMIIIPDKGADASHEAYQRFVRQNALVHIEIQPRRTGARPFPFFVSSEVKEGRLQLYDLPTTLRASREAIKLVMPANTSREELAQLEAKEIQNFSKTIEFLLKEPESDGFGDNIHLIQASQLFKV